MAKLTLSTDLSDFIATANAPAGRRELGVGVSNIYLSEFVTSDADGAIGYGETAPSGTDRTSAIQAVFAAAAPGTTIVWDVAVGLSAPILIPSDITIFAPGRRFGAILRAAANCPMFRNAGIATDATTDKQKTFGKVNPTPGGDARYRLCIDDPDFYNNENIAVIGGTWNGNRAEQTGYPFTGAYGFLSAFQFWGVKNLVMRDCYILRPMSALPIHCTNCYGVRLDDIEGDMSPINPLIGNSDTCAVIQFDGPSHNIDINRPITHSDDDAIAFNPDTTTAAQIDPDYAGGIPTCVPGVNWPQNGRISGRTRVTEHRITKGVEDVIGHGCIRLLTSVHAIEDLLINGQSGTVSKFAYTIGPIATLQITGVGVLGKIKIVNTSVEMVDAALDDFGVGNGIFDIRSSFDSFEIGYTGGARSSDTAPIINIQNPTTGTISGGSLIVDLNVDDQSNRAIPLIQVAAPVKRILGTANATHGAATQAPIVAVEDDAVIGLIKLSGDFDNTENVVTYQGGTVETVILEGSHRHANGGSPLNIASGLTLENFWYKDLAFNTGNDAFSGAGTVTNDNSYVDSGGAPATGVDDEFAGTDGDLIAGRTPAPVSPGNNWETLIGTGADQTIQTNKAAFACNAASEVAVIDSLIADGTVTAKLTFPSGGSALLVFRATGSSDYYQVLIAAGGTALYKIEGGSPDTRDFDAIALTPGTEYTVTVTMSGSTISAQVGLNDPLVDAVASFNATATKHGIGGYHPSTGTITADDFEVSP